MLLIFEERMKKKIGKRKNKQNIDDIRKKQRKQVNVTKSRHILSPVETPFLIKN